MTTALFARIRPGWWVAAVLLGLCFILFGPALFGGQAFVPADLLAHLSPWASSDVPATSPWNVLRFDGITEFYPWRLVAARAFHDGHLPLWNPYTFGATGGVPLLANSQSAPLYPPNLIFWLMPSGFFWYAFGLSAAFHWLVLTVGTYRLLRVSAASPAAAVFGAATLGLSAPVITWLSLPTFLNVTCWIPWLLLLVGKAYADSGTAEGRRAVWGVGLITGLMILAGHLQMAFYGLLCAVVYTLWRGVPYLRQRKSVLSWAAGLAGAGVLALCFALPQVLPVVELSRVSHRAGGTPTNDAYDAYTLTAFPVRNLVTLLTPDFFGHPNRNAGFYWNTNNYAEWAVYVGVVPLVLAVFALLLPWRGAEARSVRERGFFAVLLLLTFFMAMPTPLNRLFYFVLPGFSQTGNPARCLFLAAFALAALAALGLDALLHADFPKQARERAVAGAILLPLLVAAIGASDASRWAAQKLPTVPFSELLAPAKPEVVALNVLLAFAGIVLFVAMRQPQARRQWAGATALVLACGDLLVWGWNYNPTSRPEDVYRETPGMAFLRANAAPNDLVAPINVRWSLGSEGPRDATLPPNGLAVYGLHDVGGYDSLLPKTAKDTIRDAGGVEPSPQENGNMVFVKTAEAARTLGARWVITGPNAPPVENASVAYDGTDMRVWALDSTTARTFDSAPGLAYKPTSFRFGLFAGLCACAGLAAVGANAWLRPRQFRR